MNQMAVDFSINKENFQLALEAIKNLHGQETCDDHFSWVNHRFYEIDNIKDMLKAWRWQASFDSDGNICELQFTGEKYGDEDLLFRAIAPYVTEYSYIEMRGEDGDEWRWVFREGKCKGIKAKISKEWPEWEDANHEC